MVSLIRKILDYEIIPAGPLSATIRIAALFALAALAVVVFGGLS